MDTIKKILHTCFCCNVRLAAVCRAGGTMFLFVLLPAVVAEVDVNDTLIVREILDANGLTTVPVSAVIGGGVGRIYGVYLDDLGLTVLPECIGGLDSLGNLRLNNNRLTSLPKAIGNLKNFDIFLSTTTAFTSFPMN